MKKFYIASILFLLPSFASAFVSPQLEQYLTDHNLTADYQKKMEDISSTSKKYQAAFGQDLEKLLKCDFNDDYKDNLMSRLLTTYYTPYESDETVVFSSSYAVRYDPIAAIKYLETKTNRDFGNNFQLMILWHVYQPEKIQSKQFVDIVEEAHKIVINDQNTWEKDKYTQKVGEDYLQCYQDLECFMDIIPYWYQGAYYADNMIIPCDTAHRFDKIVYFEKSGGAGHIRAYLINDCDLHDKYLYQNQDLDAYTIMLHNEKLADGDGSIRYTNFAVADQENMLKQFDPRFDLPEQKHWDIFPYTEWSVESYYNFRKYNTVLNSGIGYQKALKEMIKHYMQNFGVTRETAYNTALYTLEIPSMGVSDFITADHLNYMLLTGRPWEEIEQKHPDLKNYDQLLEFSVAYPQNVKKIIEAGKKQSDFNIDYPNEFGKTPLMLAAQYGHLETLQILLENGADINKQTDDGNCWSEYGRECIRNGRRTALMYAAQEGMFEVVKFLIDHGTDVKLKDSAGKTAYDYMLGLALEYDPQKLRAIYSGTAEIYTVDENQRSLFSKEQLDELTTLLN